MKEKLLQLRKAIKAKKPDFRTQDSHKKKRLSERWTKARGIDSKIRLGLKGYRKAPSQGYRSPQAVRGLHKSGLQPVLVSTVSELAQLNKSEHGIVISSSVGNRKRVEIIRESQKLSLNVLNFKDPAAFLASVESALTKKKEAKATARKEKEAKKKEKEKKAKEKESKDKESKEKEQNQTEKASGSGKVAGDSSGSGGLTDRIKEEEKKEMDKILTTKE